MPRSTLFLLAWDATREAYILSFQDDSSLSSLELPLPDTPEWHLWLDQVNSFTFHVRYGHRLTLRKDVLKRGTCYWYAYLRVQQRVRKRYVGKSVDLSLARADSLLPHCDPDRL